MTNPAARGGAGGRCLRLRYASQGQDRASRLQSRADELYARAGYESDDGKYIYKHKWMRWRTFNRLMDCADKMSAQVDDAFVYRAMRILGMS